MIGCVLCKIQLEKFSFIWRCRKSPLSVHSCTKVRPLLINKHLWHLEKEGSLSCQTCFDTRPRFWSLIQRTTHLVALYKKQGHCRPIVGYLSSKISIDFTGWSTLCNILLASRLYRYLQTQNALKHTFVIYPYLL